ncbi:sensor histidine kinase [Longispora albida]|uniref:sensor histidine kinase n=1 Tax=Longispora albida TaxID=203523 RepID=UPI00036E111E|nr:HAMP domain-containing sensor histidine kinase [Longispora albida]
MSSNQPNNDHEIEQVRPGSLRFRLLAGLLALLAVAGLVIGVITALALHSFLVGQVDTKLRESTGRVLFRLPPGAQIQVQGTVPPQGLEFLAAPGQPLGALGAVVRDGKVTTAATVEADGFRAVTVAGLEDVPADGDPHTVGGYRVIALQSNRGEKIVSGLPLDQVNATAWRLVAVEAGVTAGVLIIALFAGAGVIRFALRPLDRVAAIARRVAGLPLDRGEVALAERVPDTRPGTEIGQVGAALNRMLEHIADALAARQASETRVRHFVADASHELRTPLAAIRGYAELTRRGDQPVPADIAYATGRIEAESARMTALVDDLLLLARLDSGRPLERSDVDLSRLLIDAVNDARIAGREHRFSLGLPAEPVTVPGDAARLQQVMANLLTNARSHTPPGTVISVSLTGTGKIMVTDNGPGIPPDLLPDVFERFARGDSSRSRESGGTGLGLSIVSAVVGAHGGSVRVDSRPGRTTFTVDLPST